MPRVLVVDDEEDLRVLSQLILENAGFEVESAASGQQALAMLQEDPFDLLILDIRMAKVDGWRVLEQLQERGQIDRLPVLVASAHVEPNIRTRALELGCRGFVVKPFSPAGYVEAVRAALAGAGNP